MLIEYFAWMFGAGKVTRRNVVSDSFVEVAIIAVLRDQCMLKTGLGQDNEKPE